VIGKKKMKRRHSNCRLWASGCSDRSKQPNNVTGLEDRLMTRTTSVGNLETMNWLAFTYIAKQGVDCWQWNKLHISCLPIVQRIMLVKFPCSYFYSHVKAGSLRQFKKGIKMTLSTYF
jgi:hypothetical protein